MVRASESKSSKQQPAAPSEIEENTIPDRDVSELDSTRETGRSIRIVTGSYEHNLFCTALTFAPQGEVFTPIFHFTPHLQSIRCLATSKRFLASGSNDELIRLYDLQRRKELGTLMQHTGQVLCMKFFESKWLLSGGGDNKVILWRVQDWEFLGELKGHKGPVVDLDIHPSGKVALSVGEDRYLFLWNLMTGRKASKLKLRDTPRKILWLPDNTSYVIGFDKKLVTYKNGEEVSSVPLKSNFYAMTLTTIKDQPFLCVSLANGKIQVFKVNSEVHETPEFELSGHTIRVKDMSVLDKYLVSVSSDGKIVVWDMEQREEAAVYTSGDRLNCVVLVPDEVEKFLKRDVEEVQSEYETEPEAVPQPKKKKPKKAKKPKVEIIR